MNATQTTTQTSTTSAPALAVARFAGFSIGSEYNARIGSSALPTQIVRAWDQAVRHGKVASGTLRAFTAGWRMAETAATLESQETAVILS